jgi:hypothetical protein
MVDSTGGLDQLRYLYVHAHDWNVGALFWTRNLTDDGMYRYLQYNLLDTFDVNFPYLETL